MLADGPQIVERYRKSPLGCRALLQPARAPIQAPFNAADTLISIAVTVLRMPLASEEAVNVSYSQ
jgi:hypothetical protein